MNQYCYSPRPIRDYHITLSPVCEASTIGSLDGAVAIWNLFWLSTPTIDRLAGRGSNDDWYTHYRPVPKASAAVVGDAVGDEVMYRKLHMHPTAFANWFERVDQSIYDCYHVLGGQAWVDIVLSRAALAAVRLASEVPAIARSENNVHYLVFGKKQA